MRSPEENRRRSIAASLSLCGALTTRLAPSAQPGYRKRRDITSLGSIIVVVITTAAVAGYLFLDHRPGVAWLILLAVAGGIALNNLLKLVFARHRPDVVTHAARVFTTSFPSGSARAVDSLPVRGQQQI